MTRHHMLLAAGALALAVGGCGSSEQEADKIRAEASILGVEVTETSEVEQYDMNGDSKPDIWKYFSLVGEDRRRAKARDDRDFNYDGKVDSRQHFSPEGAMVREELDLDFDGRFDAVDYYQAGALTKREMAFDFGQNPTVWKHYEGGKLIRKERDTNGNGRPDTIEYWEDDKLLRVGYDRDGDGTPDFFEEATDQ